MTLIAVLIALTLGHFLRVLGRVRRTSWLRPYTGVLLKLVAPLPSAVGLILALAPILILVWLILHGLTEHYGIGAWFAMSVLVLVYSWGPRDLDLDVEAVLHAEDEESQAAAAHRLKPSAASSQPKIDEAALTETVFYCALERWFGVLLWFVVLGPVGALGYRLLCVLASADSGGCKIPSGWHTSARFLRAVLDWPAAQLMALSLALVSHFDPVLAAWRNWYKQGNHNWFAVGFLPVCGLRAVAVADLEGKDPRHPLATAMGLIWRVLFLWLTLLALLTLAGIAL